jgi:tetratricopeptide (TPR) repeat protein
MDKIEEANNKFREAAELYMQAHAHHDKDSDKKLNIFAANLYVKGREFVKAADIFFGEGDYEKAADLYRAAKKYDKAAISFEKASILILML